MKENIKYLLTHYELIVKNVEQQLKSCETSNYQSLTATVRSFIPLTLKDGAEKFQESLDKYVLTEWRSHYLKILNNLDAFNVDETRACTSLARLHELAKIEIEVAKRKYLESFVKVSSDTIIVKEALRKEKGYTSGARLIIGLEKVNTILNNYSGLSLSKAEFVRLDECLRSSTIVIISQPVTKDKAKFTINTKTLDLYIEIL